MVYTPTLISDNSMSLAASPTVSAPVVCMSPSCSNKPSPRSVVTLQPSIYDKHAYIYTYTYICNII